MEYNKITKLLDTTSENVLRFVTNLLLTRFVTVRSS